MGSSTRKRVLYAVDEMWGLITSSWGQSWLRTTGNCCGMVKGVSVDAKQAITRPSGWKWLGMLWYDEGGLCAQKTRENES